MRLTLVDWALAAAAVASFGWIVLERERILWRFVYVDPLACPDLVFGPLAVLLVIEATRRTLALVPCAFLVYALAGPYMRGNLEHRGVAPAVLIEHLYLVPERLFNQITGIMATYLLVFLTFGTFLRPAGGDRIFMELGIGMAGRTVGGPAKAAVIGSALMGSVSGSTIADVVTTGTVTIPLMRPNGYRPHEAAAIETAAGTGGAVMPLVMGVGVFVMSELTGIPLMTLLTYSLPPALVYFGSVFAYVHLKAAKHSFQPMKLKKPVSVRRTLTGEWHLLAPLAVLIHMLRETRLTPRRLASALEASTRGALMLSGTAASAAVIMSVVGITGPMLKVTSGMVALAGGSLFLGLTPVELIASVIGMRLPVTSTYIIVSALGAPAFADLGAPLLAAHLIIFWFAQTATIAPPVRMTAFVAASIAGARPMRTGLEAMSAGKALYLVQLMFAYTHIPCRLEYGASFSMPPRRCLASSS